MKEIDNYMTVKEAAHRFNVSRDTLKDTLAMRRDASKQAVQPLIDAGLIKYFKLPNDKRGEWIITVAAMEKLYKKTL